MRKLWKTKLLDKAIILHNLVKRHKVETSVDFSALHPQHILIFSTTALGDFLFNTPAIRAIRQRYPDAMITLIAHQKFSGFLDKGDDWDNLVFWNNKAITIPGLLKQLKPFPTAELALLLHSHEPYDYLCAIFAGAKYLIKDNYKDNVPLRDKWLADYIVAFKGHIIERKLELVHALGCDVSNIEMKLPISIPEKNIHAAPTIGLQLGASTPERCWAPENFAVMTNQLISRYSNLSFILIGGPGDKNRAEAFLNYIPEQHRGCILNQVGETSLPELCILINNLDLLVTGDTGPLHIAVTVKTPTLGLFVTANPYATGAFQNPELHRMIYIGHRRSNQHLDHIMDVIKPERVVEQVECMLRKTRAETLPIEKTIDKISP